MKVLIVIPIIVIAIIAIVIGLVAYSYTQIQLSLDNVSYQGLDFATPTGGTLFKLAADFLTGNWIGFALTLVTGVKLGLAFGLSNHGFFPVYIPDVSYDILVNGIKIGQGQSHISSTINPGETRSFQDNTQDIQFGTIEPTITSIVSAGGMANFQVSGTAYFNFLGINVPVPFQSSKQINVVDEIKNHFSNYLTQNQQSSQNSYQQNQQSYQPPPQVQESISVYTDKTSYNYGDTITASGVVNPIIPNQVVTLQVYFPNGQTPGPSSDTHIPNYDGSYQDRTPTLNRNLPAGTYTIIARYAGAQSQTTFYYSGTPIPQTQQPTYQQAPPQVQKQSTTVANSIFTVSPGTYRYFSFTTQCAGTLTGAFAAKAILGNNIIVYVLNQNGFNQFQNGQSAPAYYNSGKVSSSTFNLSLNPGAYYIVLSNQYSLISTKNVGIDALYTCS